MSIAPKLTWLHVSDLHFGHGDAHYRFDQQGVTGAILRDAEERAKVLGPPDLIFVTGDIAFSGQKEQYAQAKDWLTKLLAKVGGSPRLFVVPGNHDVDRKQAAKLSAAALHRELRGDPKKLDELLRDASQMQALWPKLGAYAEFAKDLGTPALTAESPFYSQEVDCQLGGKVVVVGLNTTLLCLDDQDGPKTLGLGRGQILKAIEQQPTDALLLVLQHHPPEWLSDGRGLAASLQQCRQIQFSGHVHQQQGLVHMALLSSTRLQFVAGAGHTDQNEEGSHAYAWGQLSEEGLAYYSRVWLPERKGFAPATMLDNDDFKRGDHAFIERARLPKKLADWLSVNSSSVAPKPAKRQQSSSVAPKPAFLQQPSTKRAPELFAFSSHSLEPINTSIGLAHLSPALKDGLRPQPQSPLQADVVIITALKLEYDEALKVEAGAVDAWTFSRELLSTDVAFRTFLTSDGRPMRVAMTWTTSMGEGAATDAAVSLLDKLQAGCLAMCGVCAGRRTRAVHPGDVILASLAYRYDTGAVQVEYDERDQPSRRFQASPGPIPLDDTLKARAQVFRPALDPSFLHQRPATLAAQCDWILEQLNAGVDPMAHPQSVQRCPAWPAAIHRLENLGYVAFSETGALSLTNKGKAYIGPLLTRGRGSLPVPEKWKFHVAPIATGGNVMRDPKLFDQLSTSMKEVLGVDMEVAGIAHTAHKRKLPWVAMKGVMDHADNDKDDLLKEFAAQASAECLLLFLRENPPALHGTRARQEQHNDGKSPKQPPSLTNPAPSSPLRVTPQLEQQKKNALRFIQESPALTKALLDNGLGDSTLSGAAFAQAVLDSLLPLSPSKVTERLAALAAATQLLDPVRELLWRILPLTSGWDEVFQEAEATGASRSVLVLPWRTTTLAEIEMARMDGRRVTFEPEGEVPQGILHVPLPAEAYAPLFDSDGARLADAVLENLYSEQPPGGPVPNANFWRSIRKAFPSKKEFFEEAKSTLNSEDFGGRRYLLFIDQLLMPQGAEPDVAWTVAQTAIQRVLPGLRLVRLKGERIENSKETEILRPIQKIRRLS